MSTSGMIPLLIYSFKQSFFNGSSRIPRRNNPGFYIAKHTGARSNNRAFTYANSWSNEDIRRHPGPITDLYGTGHQWHFWISVIMARRTKKTVLAHRNMRADLYPGHAVTIHLFAKAAVIPHLQIPGCPYPCRWIGVNRLTQLGSKHSKQQAAPSMKRSRGWPVKQEPYQIP